MTNYLAVSASGKRGFNKKDGATGRRRRKSIDWADYGFTFIDLPSKWSYTWNGDFPVFRIAPSITSDYRQGIVARFKDGDIEIFFQYGTHPSEIKERLDDEILAIMRHDAEIVEAELDWEAWQVEGLAIDIDEFMVEGDQCWVN